MKTTEATVLRFSTLFMVFGGITKYFSEIIHEVIGHGIPVLLLGYTVHGFKISIWWPYELSSIYWDVSGASRFDLIIIYAGGILACGSVALILQLILLVKQFRWELNSFLTLLSFWCYVNAFGYLIVGSLSPFGDIAALINLELFSQVQALLIGFTFFIVGFFNLSTILRSLFKLQGLKPYHGLVVLFWCLIPILVVLTIIGQGMFNPVILVLGCIPVMFSYLIEFQVYPMLRNSC